MDTKNALAVMLLLDHEEMDGDWEIAAPVIGTYKSSSWTIQQTVSEQK